MKSKGHSPERMCIVCGKKLPKNDMVRVLYNDGFIIDTKQIVQGRGRYICGSAHKGINTGKALRRSFRQAAITDAEITKLMADTTIQLELII